MSENIVTTTLALERERVAALEQVRDLSAQTDQLAAALDEVRDEASRGLELLERARTSHKDEIEVKIGGHEQCVRDGLDQREDYTPGEIALIKHQLAEARAKDAADV